MTDQTREVLFNDVKLSTLMTVDDLDLNQYPDYEIRRYKVARADKSITTSKEAVSKEIPIIGRICGANRGAIELNLALLKLLVFGISGQLQVKQAGSDVIYTATCDNITESWNRSVLNVELIFTAGDPFGMVIPATVLELPNITTASSSFSLPVFSSVPVKPEINLVFNSVTTGTNKTVSIVNSSTNIGMSINTDFATGDTLYINSEQMIILHNGQPVDFTGSFPVFTVTIAAIFVPEVNMSYTDDFGARDVDGTFIYNARI